MRYRMNREEDNVTYLIGQCMRNRAEARRMYEKLISQKQRKIDLITGTVHLDDKQYAEFVARFSSEIEPMLWETSRRVH